jgi:glycolate oxidase FAD binding subunit
MVDEVSIRETQAPKSIEEVGRVVADLAAEGTAVFPVGGQTALDYGLPASRPGVAIDCTHLAHIDDYPSEDMTITIEAGVRMSELSRILAEKNQMLPVDASDSARATLGGAIATNTSGPRRFGYGTLRDYVIGIDVIDAAGRRVHGGGRVVKNVAGYDLMKLHIGALGTLGVVVQVSLKLRPVPESRAVIGTALRSDQIEPVLERLNRSETRPVAIELVNAETGIFVNELTVSDRRPFGLVLLFEESRAAVDWQLQQVRREVGELGVSFDYCPAREKYGEILETLTNPAARADAVLVFKATMLPGEISSFLERAARDFVSVRLSSHAGNGIVIGAVPSGSLETVGGAVDSLRRSLADRGGSLVIERCPAAWKSKLAVWGAPRDEWSVMKQLKRRLDPNNVLNPGRMLG